MIALILYMITAILWATIAVKFQYTLLSSSHCLMILCFVMNLVLCPVAMFLFIVNFEKRRIS